VSAATVQCKTANVPHALHIVMMAGDLIFKVYFYFILAGVFSGAGLSTPLSVMFMGIVRRFRLQPRIIYY
jgi:hypothetical protein